MTLPLVVKDRVIGMVDLSETRRERVFGDDEVATAQAICQVAALAIDNADLFADVQARTAETEMLNAIAQKATATLDLHEIALDVSDELRQIVPFARSYIVLLEDESVVVYRPHTDDVEWLRRASSATRRQDLDRRLMAERVVRICA